MKGVRYMFPSGLVVEFTHTPDCIQPAEAWVEGHKREARVSLVEAFESDVPVRRTVYPDGRIEDR